MAEPTKPQGSGVRWHDLLLVALFLFLWLVATAPR